VYCTIYSLPLAKNKKVRWLDSCDEQLRHSSETIQQAASKALRELTHTYFNRTPSPRLQKRVVDKYLRLVQTSTHLAETRGYALALGVLPRPLLVASVEVLESILQTLKQAAHPNARVGTIRDAETRRNALQALVAVVLQVGIPKNQSTNNDDSDSTTTTTTTTTLSSAQQRQSVFRALLKSLNDYNTDRRGDVGSWCRTEAMTGLVQLVIWAVPSSSSFSTVETTTIPILSIVGGLLKQLSEKLDHLRNHAGQQLQYLLTHSIWNNNKEHILLPDRIPLLQALQIDNNDSCDNESSSSSSSSSSSPTTINWSDAKVTFPRVLKVATAVPSLLPSIVSGLVVSVGALTKAVQQPAERALLEWIRISDNSDDSSSTTTTTNSRAEALAKALLDLLSSKQATQKRVFLPLLKTYEILLHRRVFLQVTEFASSNKVLFDLISQQLITWQEQDQDDIACGLAATSVLLGLLSAHKNNDDDETTTTNNRRILEFVVGFLLHSEYPRIRKYTADQLYVRLLEEPGILIQLVEDNLDRIHNLLLQGAWELDDTTDDMCRELAECMNLSFVPRRRQRNQQQQQQQQQQEDDFFHSYASLVKETSCG